MLKKFEKYFMLLHPAAPEKRENWPGIHGVKKAALRN
jgi:hypothetical protein